MLSRRLVTKCLKRNYYQAGNSQGIVIEEHEKYIPKHEVERFMVDCMTAVKVPEDRGLKLAQNLSEADYRGHFSHGLNRLAMYVEDLQNGLCDPKADPKILKESASTAWIDGCNGLGVVIGEFAMNVAIEKAKETGVGWVNAKHSNHFGICQWYTAMAAKENLIGMASTNTSPLVAPTRGQTPVFGTNPLAVSANGQNGDRYILDMSTSSVAVGKIEIQMRKEQDLPSKGWALGSDGTPTTDAKEAFFNGKGLMPLGGEELNSGYKGYGLGMMVEMFCALMSGSAYGPNVRHWHNYSGQVANLGQFFVAIDPERFAPGFSDRLQDLMDHLRGLEPSNPEKPVLVPGDPERIAMETVDKAGAILYTRDHIVAYRNLAKKLDVNPMQHLQK